MGFLTECTDGAFGEQHSAAGIPERRVPGFESECGETLAGAGPVEPFVGETVRLGTLSGTGEFGRPCAAGQQDARRIEYPLPDVVTEALPKTPGSQYERNVDGAFGVRRSEYPSPSVGRAPGMVFEESFQHEGMAWSVGKIVGDGGPHPAGADDDVVVLAMPGAHGRRELWFDIFLPQRDRRRTEGRGPEV